MLPDIQSWCNDCRCLSQIESEFLGCYDCQGSGDQRHMQYYDNEFPPNEESLGEPTRISEIHPTEWQSSISANPDIRLYNQIQGPSLNDVQQGRLYNGWLLSAISMLSVAPEVSSKDDESLQRGGGGGIECDPQYIPSLFVTHMGSDGKLVTESDGMCVLSVEKH